MYFWSQWGSIMSGSFQRRINVATFWASTRISILDSRECYEDSYAITQEFREWITCIGEDQDQLEASVLKVPSASNLPNNQEKLDPDEILEI